MAQPSSTTDADQRRILAAGIASGFSGGVSLAAGSLLASARFGLSLAGLVAFVGSAGRAGLFLLSGRLARAMQHQGSYRTLSNLSFLLNAVTSVLFVAAAFLAPLWVVLLTSCLSLTASTLNNSLLNHQAHSEVVRLGTLGMVGAAAGATLAGVTTGSGPLLLALVLLACASPLLGIPLTCTLPARVDEPRSRHRLAARPLAEAFVLAAVCYGPLQIYAALTAEAASPAWVGPAMIGYAAGALASPWFSRRAAWTRSTPAPLLLGALTNLLWVLALTGPLVVAIRALSGALLFTAQSALLVRTASRTDGASATLAAVIGLGLGAGLGSLIAASVADVASLAVMGVMLCALALAAALATALVAPSHHTADRPAGTST